MRRARWPLVALALPAWLAAAAPAQARTTVTLCQAADQAGPGMNLVNALATDTDIAFNCPPTAVLRINAPLPTLSRPVTLDGSLGDASQRVTLDGQGRSTVFRVGAGSLQLRNLSIVGASEPADSTGIASGSAVDSRGIVMLDNVRIAQSRRPVAAGRLEVRNSHFHDNAGVVLQADTAAVFGSRFEDNTGAPLANLLRPAGGAAVIKASRFFRNGTVTWFGELQVRDSEFNANQQAVVQGTTGGALYVGGRVSVSRTNFVGNRALRGGAIAVFGGVLEVRRCRFEANEAVGGEGGAIFVDGARPAFWSALPPPLDLRLAYSALVRNSGTQGGALALGAVYGGQASTATVTTTVLADNRASLHGGAMAGNASRLSMQRVLVKGNGAAVDGAAMAFGDDMLQVVIANSLVVHNVGRMGAALTGPYIDLLNTTVAGNDATGLRIVPPSGFPFTTGAGRLRMRNSVLSHNSLGNCAPPTDSTELLDLGNNLQFPGAACGASIPQADALLDSYFVPAPNSPARQAGDPATCSAAPVGGRDFYDGVRPQAGVCTIGAVEGTVERQALRELMRADRPLDAVLQALKQMLQGPAR